MIQETFLQNLVKNVLFLSITGILFLPTVCVGSAFSEALDTLYTTFNEARTVVYATAGFGLIGVAVAAIAGKFPWQWLAMIATALFALAMAEKIVMYFTYTNLENTTESSFNTEINDGDFHLNLGTQNNIGNYNDLKQNNDSSEFKSKMGISGTTR